MINTDNFFLDAHCFQMGKGFGDSSELGDGHQVCIFDAALFRHPCNQIRYLVSRHLVMVQGFENFSTSHFVVVQDFIDSL